MKDPKSLAATDVNDFLRALLDDLERGKRRPLSAYLVGVDNAAAMQRVWGAVHADAGIAIDSPTPPDNAETILLSQAARRLKSEPDSLAELIERAFAERNSSAPPDLIDGYELLEEVGRGGQGQVYRARDLDLGREVAIKILPLGATPDELQRLRREGRLAARLDDPCLCRAFDIGECDRGTYVVMQFVRGASLASRIAAAHGGPLTLEPAAPAHQNRRATLRLVERIARVLERMHGQGVLHRDIKPGNVMIATDGRPVLLDLGLARVGDDATLTRADDLIGTLDYMAPELFEPHGEHDERSEVWSLGVLLFECLSGVRPFAGQTRPALLESIRSSALPIARIPGANRDLRAVLETALERDRRRRYRAAGSLADDLRRLQLSEPVHARPISVARRAWRAIVRRPAAALAVGSAILLPSVWATTAQIGEARAVRFAGETLATVETLLVELAGTRLDDMPRGAALRRRLLEDAASRYERLLATADLPDRFRSALARVELELARLAMEEDDLERARQLADRARGRLADMQRNAPLASDITKILAHATLQVGRAALRQGDTAAGFDRLQNAIDLLETGPDSPRWDAARARAQYHLADARYRTGDIDGAEVALHRAIDISRQLDGTGAAAAAIGWLGLASIAWHRADLTNCEQAIHQAGLESHRAFEHDPSDRQVLGVYCLQQLVHADLRGRVNEFDLERASLARAMSLLARLKADFPHWRQVDLLRWLCNIRDIRPFIARDERAYAQRVVERMLFDLEGFAGPLSTSHELRTTAAAALSGIARQLPDDERFAPIRSEVLQGLSKMVLGTREPHTQPTPERAEALADWHAIMRLLPPDDREVAPSADSSPPSPAVAITVSSGMRISASETARAGRVDDAHRMLRSAELLMRHAYGIDASQRTRRFHYYALDARAHFLMRRGQWAVALELRQRGEEHFLYEAARRSPSSLHGFWLSYGPQKGLEPLCEPDCDQPAELRVEFARILARHLQFLLQDPETPTDVRIEFSMKLGNRGRRLIAAAMDAGWAPSQPPREDAELKVLF